MPLEEAIELGPQRVAARGGLGDLHRGHPAAGLDQGDQARVHAGPLALEVVADGGGETRVPEGVGDLRGIVEARVRFLDGPSELRQPRHGGARHPLHLGVRGGVAEPWAPGDAEPRRRSPQRLRIVRELAPARTSRPGRRGPP